MAHRGDGLNDIFDNDVTVKKKLITIEGTIHTTPTADLDIVNKKYVDDEQGNHNIADHSDTTATGTELNTLTDNSMADTLHRHSELSASDGTPDACLSVNSNGNVGIPVARTDAQLTVSGTETFGIIVIMTGTGTNNYAYYVEASGATNNYGIYSNATLNYFTGNVSALSFTDRTPYPKNLEVCYDALNSVEGKKGKLDKEKLHKILKSGEDGRDLSMTVSVLLEIVKDLKKEIELLKQS